MNINDAIHLFTSDVPGGAEALAIRMGQDPVQFRSKANPNIDRAYFRPGELVQMQQLENRFGILYAMADECDHVCIPKPTVPEGCVMEAITSLSKEFSDVLQVATQTISDGRFSDNDRKRVQKELTELIASAGRLIPALEHDGKPA
jgi:hypothetical protein